MENDLSTRTWQDYIIWCPINIFFLALLMTLLLPPSIAFPTHGWFLRLLPALSFLIVFHVLSSPCTIPSHSAPHLAGCWIASLSSVWKLHCLSSCRHLPSAGNSASHCAAASHHAPSPCHCLSCLLSGWLLCHLSSHRHHPSVDISASHCNAAFHCAMASRASCLAGYCVASPHTAASHLPTTLPLIALLPLVMPLSMPLDLAPLVQLVVAFNWAK